MVEHEHSHGIKVPRSVLITAALLILSTMALVAFFRLADINPIAQIPEPDQTIETRALRFEDSVDGTVIVYELIDGAPDRVVQVIRTGEGGFIRGVLRSLARSRRARDIGSEYPFLLTLQANGSLLLEDPQTGQRIDLRAFGPSNIEAFQALLARDGDQR